VVPIGSSATTVPPQKTGCYSFMSLGAGRTRRINSSGRAGRSWLLTSSPGLPRGSRHFLGWRIEDCSGPEGDFAGCATCSSGCPASITDFGLVSPSNGLKPLGSGCACPRLGHAIARHQGKLIHDLVRLANTFLHAICRNPTMNFQTSLAALTPSVLFAGTVGLLELSCGGGVDDR
jgi:hypothetical protein